ncbi:Endothelin-converting enzyme 1 [Schistosoma japonicum]|uniref:Endothelin-converting enzyme 1 n=1 Tax=Schistosoma japonicum TaxID=6182 RepID=A0A4Z2DA84_SCHJA|nr:Endothelin-converting enzyme 1 [Schistosoma japonicum]
MADIPPHHHDHQYVSNQKNLLIDGNCTKDDCIAFSTVGENRTSNSGILIENESKSEQNSYHLWNSHTYSHVKVWRPRNRWETFLIIAFIFILLLLIIFITLWAIHMWIYQSNACLEPACIKVAAEILSNMDTSVSPCDDFFAYSCNGWIKQNYIPQGHNAWSVMRKLSKNGEYFTKELLENRSHTDTSRGFTLAQIYYKSCMNESVIESRQFTPLYDYIVKIFNGWLLLPQGNQAAGQQTADYFLPDKFDLTDMYLPLLKYSGTIPLCRILVGQDQMNSSRFVIDLSEGYLSLQREYYVNDSYPAYSKKTEAFRRFMRNYSLLLGVPNSSLDEIDKIYEFEKQIAMKTEERSERDPEKNYELVTLQNLSSICPVLNWTKLFDYIYAPLNFTLSQDQVIALHDRTFFRDRCALYKEYLGSEAGIRTLHNAAVWSFIWKTVSRMPKQVSEMLEEYREAELGLKVDPDRWQTCVTEVQIPFGLVIGRHFVHEKFNQKSKDAATEMITEIKKAFKENFATVEWMAEADKHKAIEKVDSMKASVGYPQNINNIVDEDKEFSYFADLNESTYFENGLYCSEALFLEILRELIIQDPDKWSLPVHVVNAYYKENSNHIYFPAGILQSPLYHHEQPLSLNFGGIGMVVGHEITHAFDQHGAKFDAKGNMRDWWSPETLAAFENNSQCMIEQYSNYSILNTSLNGKMTLGENIADNGGIKAAYKAFKKLEAKYSDKPTLPGLNFTPDQLFFIGFAQLWCIKSLPQSVLNTVLFDVHTVEQYRVIGTITNSEEFARVFNCPPGSPMNPVKKCHVW